MKSMYVFSVAFICLSQNSYTGTVPCCFGRGLASGTVHDDTTGPLLTVVLAALRLPACLPPIRHTNEIVVLPQPVPKSPQHVHALAAQNNVASGRHGWCAQDEILAIDESWSERVVEI